jgi:hypothetical protein
MDKDLKEWTIAYLKNRDLGQKKIVKIEEKDKDNILNVIFKDKPNKHHILEKLDDKILKEINNNDYKTIVTFNSEENFSFIVKNWKKLCDMKNLNIIFVNMKSHDKWLINPHLHSMIADPDSIELGLRTMFDTANGKIAEPKKSKKKPSMFEESRDEEQDEDPEKEG